jgi:hypothetical protein
MFDKTAGDKILKCIEITVGDKTWNSYHEAANYCIFLNEESKINLEYHYRHSWSKLTDYKLLLIEGSKEFPNDEILIMGLNAAYECNERFIALFDKKNGRYLDLEYNELFKQPIADPYFNRVIELPDFTYLDLKKRALSSSETYKNISTLEKQESIKLFKENIYVLSKRPEKFLNDPLLKKGLEDSTKGYLMLKNLSSLDRYNKNLYLKNLRNKFKKLAKLALGISKNETFIPYTKKFVDKIEKKLIKGTILYPDNKDLKKSLKNLQKIIN